MIFFNVIVVRLSIFNSNISFYDSSLDYKINTKISWTEESFWKDSSSQNILQWKFMESC